MELVTGEEQGGAFRQAAAAALADVDALAVRGEDRRIVLQALLDARLRTASLPSPASPVRREPIVAGSGRAGGAPQDGGGDALDRISAGLKLERDTLELVYAIQEGEPHVVLSAKRVSPNKSLAARQLGQLVATARQLAGLEEWTSVATIRKVVTDYGRLDSSNFASSIQQMDNIAVIRGKGQQREVKITRPGIEATGELIKSLTGAES